MKYVEEKGLDRIEASRESEEEYKKKIWELANASLLPGTDSVSSRVSCFCNVYEC